MLDLGAGYCDFINTVEAKQKYAVDMSPELPRYVGEGVTAIQSRGSAMPGVESGTVDVVHASNFFEHLTHNELKATLAEVRRVLRPRGKLILMQPNFRLAFKRYFDDPTHRTVWTEDGLASHLESEGFSVVRKEGRFLPFSLRSRPSVIPLHRLVVRAYLALPWRPFAGQMLVVGEKI